MNQEKTEEFKMRLKQIVDISESMYLDYEIGALKTVTTLTYEQKFNEIIEEFIKENLGKYILFDMEKILNMNINNCCKYYDFLLSEDLKFNIGFYPNLLTLGQTLKLRLPGVSPVKPAMYLDIYGILEHNYAVIIFDTKEDLELFEIVGGKSVI